MRLDPLMSIPGVRSSALVGEDGLPVEMLGEGGDLLAAELASMRQLMDRGGRRMGLGRLSRLTFASDLAEVIALASGQFTVGVSLIRGSDSRLAQQQLARIAGSLATPGQGLPDVRPVGGER
ncbi:roadblock/LC7 domain-containing protein [Deinococcus sonorensis]|uniref:Roadblock/LC7 domain-containing protein n=2 Tax=Deinococcus sonorensis TaxID=309891 RepID=A0AAU7UB80_9DEIO